MESNKQDERLFDLIEKFDFQSLTEGDKAWVLSVISESEFTQMRNSAIELSNYLKPDVEPRKLHYKNIVRKLLTYPLEIYKVAAMIAILVSCYFLSGHFSQKTTTKLALTDTIYIYKTDTLITKIYDTIRIKEPVYISQSTEKIPISKNMVNNRQNIDCEKDLCPNELNKVIALGNKNNITNDSTMKNLLLSLD